MYSLIFPIFHTCLLPPPNLNILCPAIPILHPLMLPTSEVALNKRYQNLAKKTNKNKENKQNLYILALLFISHVHPLAEQSKKYLSFSGRIQWVNAYVAVVFPWVFKCATHRFNIQDFELVATHPLTFKQTKLC